MSSESGERTLHEWLRHIDAKLDDHRTSVERKLVVIDTKLDRKANADELIIEIARIRKLEEFANRVKGIAAFLSLVGGIVATVVMMGCAHYHHRTYVDGQLSSDTVSTVIGTGDTTFIGEHEEYTTSDTGLSDNGKDAIKEAVEAGVRAAIPGLP